MFVRAAAGLVVLGVIALTGAANAVDRSAGASVPKPAENGIPWSAAEVAALDGDLDRMLAAAPTLRGAHAGILVETASDGRVLYAHDAGDTIQPASTFKLLVGSVALDRLGTGYRFTTLLTRVPATDPSPAPDTLVLRGGGDPLLGAADLDAAAEAVRAAGITSARVVLDESHVAPDQRRAPGWSVDDFLAYYAPIVNGLPFEENDLDVTLVPAATLGAPPAVQLPAPFQPLGVPPGTCRPAPTFLTFTVAARTVSAGTESTADVEVGRCGDVVVTGDIPQGAPSHVDAAVDQPERLALDYFSDALRRRGVTVQAGPPGDGPIAGVIDAPYTAGPAGTVVWRHDGEPYADLLADMWLPSDNLVAEELLRELDAAAGQHAGTAAGGAALERTWLRGLGVDPGHLTIADGSGLSQYDRVTPRVLAAILFHDWHGPRRDVVLDALPIAGVRGDLRGTMLGTPAAGRVFAKTGSMSHVRGLAGYVATRSHGALIFVLSLDDWRGDDAGLAAFRAAFCSRLVRDGRAP